VSIITLASAINNGPPGSPTFKFWGDGQMPGATSTFFLHRYGIGGMPDASELISEVECLTSGTITVARFTAGSVANSKTATLRINGVDSAVALTLGSGVTSVESTGLSQAVTAGQLLSVKYVQSDASNNTARPYFVIVIE
jgi:hypothetical protein